MMIFVLPYVLITLISAFIILKASLASAVLLLLSAALGFIAGSGTRGAFYLGQKKSGLAVGAILLILGAGIGFYSKIAVGFAGVTIAADTWAGIGAVIGFFAAKPQDVLPRQTQESVPATPLIRDQ